jgi:hypothetical protein
MISARTTPWKSVRRLNTQSGRDALGEPSELAHLASLISLGRARHGFTHAALSVFRLRCRMRRVYFVCDLLGIQIVA